MSDKVVEIALEGMLPGQALDKLKPAELNTAAGRGVQSLLGAHLTQYNRTHPNKLGGKRQNWYRQMAESLHLTATAEEALLSIAHIGARIGILGGVIYPGAGASFVSGKPTRLLTIPANAAAHGERAQKFADRLRMIIFKRAKPSGLVGMLVEAEATKLNAKGQANSKLKRGIPFQRIMYWLTGRATIKPAPDLLPDEQAITASAYAGALALIKRVWAR